MVDLADFDYELPAGAIAQVPVEPRDSARLLDATPADGSTVHRHVRDLADLVGPGDVIVLNDTRVLPARLLLQKPTGGAVEVLLLQPLGSEAGAWEALVSSNRRVQPGTELAAIGMTVRVGADLGDGRREVVLDHDEADDADIIEANGVVPLPPYIHEPLTDPERYQTVYARPDASSVAAPTAGLHLTPAVLERCAAAGATVVALELEVGLGTFRPITTDRVEDHGMHRERYRIPPEVWSACQEADRVLAVGTTVVRALESAAAHGALDGDTDLFIRRGFDFRVVDRLLTNFHVPRSSLLVLLDAFVGARWRQLYEDALEHGFRFLSFGDAMLVDRSHAPHDA